MKLGVLDLSLITDHLIGLLDPAIAASNIWTPPGPSTSVDVDAFPPDHTDGVAADRVSLYLVHVARDKAQVNAPVTGSRARVPTIPHQPLPLQLYYIVTPRCATGPILEQQLMSVVLKCFHENPFIVVTVPDDTSPGNVRDDRFVLTMEQESPQSIGQLWQGIASPMRLSTVYKVGVVFIEPEFPQPEDKPKPISYHVTANPVSLPLGPLSQIIGTLATVKYDAPGPDLDPNANPVEQKYDLSPAVVALGEKLLLFGANFAGTDIVLLLEPGEPDVDITGWLVTGESTPTRRVITVPTTGPDPGIYQLRIQSGTHLSNSTPFSIAAWVDFDGGPVMAPDGGGVFTLAGRGFVEAAAELWLGGTALTRVSAAPEDGEFQVTGPTEILFKLPAGLAAGRYPVRVRVSGVESPPAKWVDVA